MHRLSHCEEDRQAQKVKHPVDLSADISAARRGSSRKIHQPHNRNVFKSHWRKVRRCWLNNALCVRGLRHMTWVQTALSGRCLGVASWEKTWVRLIDADAHQRDACLISKQTALTALINESICLMSLMRLFINAKRLCGVLCVALLFANLYWLSESTWEWRWE